ncbi:MAG: hypothetical protein IJZ84_01890 [Lachnospiraceae bacterium]|nr:hypothetical protein [Lachnospiraceae bacterium]
MEDIDKLQKTFENLDRLIDALIPFVSSEMQNKLRHVHHTLEPLKHLKDMFKTMEMMRAMQAAMNANADGTPDLSMLSGFLNPEQMQMFEMFQTMQDINL